MLAKPKGNQVRIALIGPDAVNCYTGGSGSGHVNTNAQVCPFTALMDIASKSGLAPGPSPSNVCSSNNFKHGKLIGKGFITAMNASSASECCGQCTKYPTCQAFTFEVRFIFDDWNFITLSLIKLRSL